MAERAFARTRERRRKLRYNDRRSQRLEEREDRLMLAVSPSEQDFIYLLKRARHALEAFEGDNGINGDLPKVPMRAPLPIDCKFSALCRHRAGVVATRSSFGHQGPLVGDWSSQFVHEPGFSLLVTWLDEENYVETIVARTAYTDATRSIVELLEDRSSVGTWHRRQLLEIHDAFNWSNHAGVGHANGGNGLAIFDHYWAATIALSLAARTMLTGAIFGDVNGSERYEAGDRQTGDLSGSGERQSMAHSASAWP